MLLRVLLILVFLLPLAACGKPVMDARMSSDGIMIGHDSDRHRPFKMWNPVSEISDSELVALLVGDHLTDSARDVAGMEITRRMSAVSATIAMNTLRFKEHINHCGIDISAPGVQTSNIEDALTEMARQQLEDSLESSRKRRDQMKSSF